MDDMKLKIKLIDIIKNDIKFVLPFIILGLLFAIFVYGVDLLGALSVLPIALLVVFAVQLFEAWCVYLTLEKDGFVYRNNSLKENFCSWGAKVNIFEGRAGKYTCINITDPSSNHTVHIPKVILGYPEVQQFIQTKVPKDHEIQRFINS